MKKKIITSVFLLFIFNEAISQITIKDSINEIIKNSPSFTIFKDNYFISGLPITGPINGQTTDVKYQISFKERLTNATLPFKTYLFLNYTQKSFWKIYSDSSPFADNNYNPSIALGKIFITKSNQVSVAAFAFEHESNGKDGLDSRSWNRLIFHYTFPIAKNGTLNLQTWFPMGYKDNNPDLIEFMGYGEINYVYQTKRFVFDTTIRKGANWTEKGSIISQIHYKLSKNNNQYLSIQHFWGYGESLLNYSQKTNMIRIGIVFKPSKFGFN